MTFSSSGMIGAAVGLAWAILDYFVLLPMVMRPLQAGFERARGEERERAGRRLRLIRFIFAVQFVVFPIVGYIVGAALEA